MENFMDSIHIVRHPRNPPPPSKMRSFDEVFFVVILNKLIDKQWSWQWVARTLLWRSCHITNSVVAPYQYLSSLKRFVVNVTAVLSFQIDYHLRTSHTIYDSIEKLWDWLRDSYISQMLLVWFVYNYSNMHKEIISSYFHISLDGSTVCGY